LNICGIIAEFDPFHNGHKFLIESARASGSTHIAVVMSGSAVQRGTPAMFGKYKRASAALKSGADLVLEMPAPYSCSNAEIFAKAGVTALASLGDGVVSRLVFGSETADTELIVEASFAADELRQSDRVKKLLSEGMNYPSAVCTAAEEGFGKEISSVLRNPNSTLALEYCRALRSSAPFIEPFAVARKGALHNSTDTDGVTASGSKIREMISHGEDVSALMPSPLDDPCLPDRLDKIFLYKLLSADKDDLLSLPDVDPAIADRILRVAERSFSRTEDFLAAARSKDITAARLRRLAIHLVLGINKQDIAPLPYVRILALNERGREILASGSHKLPTDTSLARLEKTSAQAARVSLIERRASQLRALGTSSGSSVNEYTVSVKLTNS